MLVSRLGISPITEDVYYGKVNPKNPDVWVGNKRDVTQEFYQVLLNGFLEKGTSRSINCNDKKDCILMNMDYSVEGCKEGIKRFQEYIKEIEGDNNEKN